MSCAKAFAATRLASFCYSRLHHGSPSLSTVYRQVAPEAQGMPSLVDLRSIIPGTRKTCSMTQLFFRRTGRTVATYCSKGSRNVTAQYHTNHQTHDERLMHLPTKVMQKDTASNNKPAVSSLPGTPTSGRQWRQQRVTECRKHGCRWIRFQKGRCDSQTQSFSSCSDDSESSGQGSEFKTFPAISLN